MQHTDHERGGRILHKPEAVRKMQEAIRPVKARRLARMFLSVSAQAIRFRMMSTNL